MSSPTDRRLFVQEERDRDPPNGRCGTDPASFPLQVILGAHKWLYLVSPDMFVMLRAYHKPLQMPLTPKSRTPMTDIENAHYIINPESALTGKLVAVEMLSFPSVINLSMPDHSCPSQNNHAFMIPQTPYASQAKSIQTLTIPPTPEQKRKKKKQGRMETGKKSKKTSAHCFPLLGSPASALLNSLTSFVPRLPTPPSTLLSHPPSLTT